MSEVAIQRSFRSTHRGARVSPFKVREVAAVIRGLPVPQALATLGGLKKRSAALLLKVLKTAVANGQDQDADLDAEDFRVASVRVDMGLSMKRARFRAYGRVARYKHRTAHITVVIQTTAKD